MAVLDLISIGIVVGFDPEVTSSAAEAWWYYTMLVFDTPWTQTRDRLRQWPAGRSG
jgi:hypothetical protein